MRMTEWTSESVCSFAVSRFKSQTCQRSQKSAVTNGGDGDKLETECVFASTHVLGHLTFLLFVL